MVTAQLNPSRLVVELPGREPYIIWDETQIGIFIQETFEAGYAFRLREENKK